MRSTWLAILAQVGNSIDVLQEAPPDRVSLPLDLIYEREVDNSTAQSERDRRIRNEQLKNAWFIEYQKIEAAVILCGNRPWKFC